MNFTLILSLMFFVYVAIPILSLTLGYMDKDQTETYVIETKDILSEIEEKQKRHKRYMRLYGYS